jgi:excinuclease ABC subunit B
VIVVSSVSCIYGMGNPADFASNVIHIKKGDVISRNKFLFSLVSSLYSRTEADFHRGNFRVKGDTVDIYLAYADYAIRVYFWGDEIENIESIEASTGKKIEVFDSVNIYPANIFVTSQDSMKQAIHMIQDDLLIQTEYFKESGRSLEAKRLEDRVTYDMEMMRELGYCSGIENYSRYFDKRLPGTRPYCLLDYFPDDYLLVVDESHVTIPQVHAMYGGDRSRKINLVDYGFRLPAAMDNRPLKFEEFQTMINQVIYVSATPADYELAQSEGVVVEQMIRPTGLLDPVIEVRPSINQVDDLLDEIRKVVEREERILVTTLTKRMSEELQKYFMNLGIRCRYIHSDVETLERIEILRDLRLGLFDVLIGINLLREGLDLPEVSLVAILDADKEGFLRSTRAMVQTVGRAARNVNGKVIMYADRMTDSMQRTIDETLRRRHKQIEYNFKHNITPVSIIKSKESIMRSSEVSPGRVPKPYVESDQLSLAADPVLKYMNREELQKAVSRAKKAMESAAKELDFVEAARLRDELFSLQKLLENK